jgi:hypothetical protein
LTAEKRMERILDDLAALADLLESRGLDTQAGLLDAATETIERVENSLHSNVRAKQRGTSGIFLVQSASQSR